MLPHQNLSLEDSGGNSFRHRRSRHQKVAVLTLIWTTKQQIPSLRVHPRRSGWPRAVGCNNQRKVHLAVSPLREAKSPTRKLFRNSALGKVARVERLNLDNLEFCGNPEASTEQALFFRMFGSYVAQFQWRVSNSKSKMASRGE